MLLGDPSPGRPATGGEGEASLEQFGGLADDDDGDEDEGWWWWWWPERRPPVHCLGATHLRVSLMSWNLRDLSASVVADREGEAFTSISQGFRASSTMMSYP